MELDTKFRVKKYHNIILDSNFQDLKSGWKLESQIISTKLLTPKQASDSFRSRHPPDTLDWPPRDREGLSTEERHLHWRVHRSTQKSRDSLLDIEAPDVRANSTTLSLTSAQLIEVRIDLLTCYDKPPISKFLSYP